MNDEVKLSSLLRRSYQCKTVAESQNSGQKNFQHICAECKEIQSIPDFVHDSELKELSTSSGHTAQQQRACERGDVFRCFSHEIDEDGCMNKISIMLNKWYLELKKCLMEEFKINAGHDKGTWHDIRLKRSTSDGATELSFVTSYKQMVLCVVISSLFVKKSNSYMPSAVSSDSSIKVHSSMHLNNLADYVADCVSKQTDAYTLLVDAVWRSMEEAGNIADQAAQPVCNC